jgi:hypothetical protein
MTFVTLRRGALALALLLTGTAASEAMPVPSGLAVAADPASPVQYRPGYHNRQQYRRALRRYRGHPGARFELKQNRRIFCRNTPERC